MFKMFFSSIAEEKGSVGILSIITMLLLGVMGAAYISLSFSEVSSSASYRNGVAAQYLAEAGARRAIVELVKNSAWTGVSDVGMGSGITAGKYSVTVSTSSSDRTILSTGVVGNATRKVELKATLESPPFPYPVFSDNHLTLNSGFVVEGGKVATSKNANQVENNGFTGAVVTDVTDVTLPVIPVTFNKNDYKDGNTTTLSSTPGTGNYNLSGLYFIDGNFTTNSGVNLYATGSNSATIYVEGDVSINGDVTGNITIIAKKDLTTNSGTAMSGTINLYAGQNMTLNRSMTGNITIMSKNDLTINSSASELNQATIYSKHDITFNSGVHLTGVIISDNKFTGNGGRVTYPTTIVVNSWAQK